MSPPPPTAPIAVVPWVTKTDNIADDAGLQLLRPGGGGGGKGGEGIRVTLNGEAWEGAQKKIEKQIKEKVQNENLIVK